MATDTIRPSLASCRHVSRISTASRFATACGSLSTTERIGVVIPSPPSSLRQQRCALGLQQAELLGRLGLLDEQVRLLGGGFDAAAGDVEVGGLDLDSDEAPSELDAGYARGAGAHEGVENGLGIIGELLYAPLHQRNRLLRRVNARRVLFASLPETLPQVIVDPCSPPPLDPRKLHIRVRVIDLCNLTRLVP